MGHYTKYIKGLIRKNKNFIAAIVGVTGSGKSWSGLRLGEMLDDDFDVRNVCFNPEEFMDLVNGKTKKLKTGSVIIFDEIQVSMSHVEWQSLHARLINYVLQTFRHKNFILFMTAPHFSFINASIRRLIHARFQTVKIDEQKEITTLKGFLFQTNQDTNKIYKKYLRLRTGEKVTSLKLKKPTEQLIKDYEKKKDIFTRELNLEIALELRRIREKKAPKLLTEQQEKVLACLKKGMVIPEISKELCVSIQAIYDRIKSIKKKGYEIEPINEKGGVKRYEIGCIA